MKIFKEFEGKTAFVTGAASGMGQAAAICFGGLGCRWLWRPETKGIGNGAGYTGKRR